ncbi:MAG: class I SAM-dependent methyltransferase [Thiobacillus sp.]|nr:class I SAM-dependent methyltransferase [Thiobacillus sp.]
MNAPRLIDTVRRVVQASLTNQIARYAPSTYVQLTGQTGRGAGEVRLDEVSDYFETCLDDYFAQLSVGKTHRTAFLRGKRILEYGPGDVPGVAILMVANGADQVVCVDRFPLVRMSAKNIEIVKILLTRLSQPLRERAEACFRQAGRPESGLNSDRISYLVRPSGLSGLRDEIDLVISRAVLEHVNDLPATFRDMYSALKPGGIALHQVDLKSHGLHRENPLDFLNWPPWLWSVMYSAKGVPNRLRANAYRDAVQQCGFELVSMTPTLQASADDVRAVRAHLAAPFRNLSDTDLAWLGFWLICRKPAVQTQ